MNAMSLTKVVGSRCRSSSVEQLGSSSIVAASADPKGITYKVKFSLRIRITEVAFIPWLWSVNISRMNIPCVRIQLLRPREPFFEIASSRANRRPRQLAVVNLEASSKVELLDCTNCARILSGRVLPNIVKLMVKESIRG